jgi:hypothetical protein
MNHRNPVLRTLAAFGLVAASSVAHAQVNCCLLPNATVTGFVNNDVIAPNCSCTIARTATVNGNVEQSGIGSLVVRGNVNGGVTETGAGNLTIDRAIVGGDCLEADGGSLVVRPGSSVNGALFETGPGNVTVTATFEGPAKGDIDEAGGGGVQVTVLSGAYEGNINESDAGSVETTVAVDSAFKGGIAEDFDGSATAVVEGLFEGNIEERGAGDLATSGTGLFKGNTEHEVPGVCSNTILRFEGSSCAPL